jgi:hypothetical protein
MANFTKKFGIKEVADVAFYNVETTNSEGTKVPTVTVNESTGEFTALAGPVLTFDSLKVSTLEMTAEQAEARGGKGNPPLIIWDHGREVNVTLEDALLSMETLEAMFGDATTTDNVVTINAKKFPGVYTVIGQTYEGLDVVEALASLETDDSGIYKIPKDDIMINSVKIDVYKSEK